VWVACRGNGAAATGSGNPATAEPLSDWLNAGANLLCVVIAVLVLPLLRTRTIGAIAAGVNMLISMVANVLVDGPGYALMILPFNIVTLAVSRLMAWHHRANLGRGAGG